VKDADDRYVGAWAGGVPPRPATRAWHVAAAATALSVTGGLLGGVARLFVPDGGPVWCWAAGGAALGAVTGGLLEADRLHRRAGPR
jgi:hypothetical protein